MRELSSEELDHICWQHLSELPYFRGMLRAVEHSLFSRFELEEPVLDIGSGDGHFGSKVLMKKSCIGIDPWWKPMPEAIRTQFYAQLIQARGDSIPFRANFIPNVISNSVLEHISDVQPVLNEVHRVLKSGGCFFFTVTNNRFKSDLWGSEIFRMLGLRKFADLYSVFFNKIARHQHLDDETIWIERLRRAGFRDIEFWNYFPKPAIRMLERGHLFGLPNLIWKKLFGKWVLFPSKKNPFLPIRKLRALLQDPLSKEGTCTFYMARKA